MPRILIVDDEEPIRLLIQRVLEVEGHQCTLAENCREARAHLQAEEFDLIICDIHMPGESGLDLIRYVREAHPDMATLMVTVMDDPRVADDLLAIGVYGYILKPFMPNEILIHVSNALRRRELELKQKRQRDILEQVVEERTAALRDALRELEEAHESLKKSEERYRSILSNIEEGYYEVDLEGNFTFVNDALCRITGLSREELLGLNYKDYMDPETAKKTFEVFHRVFLTGQPVKNYPHEIVLGDGTRRYMELSVSLIRGADGTPVGFRGINRDVTEHRLMEMRFGQSRKLEAIGQLAAGIAHEINTPIQYVGDNTRFLEGAFEDLRRVIHEYNALKQAAEHGGEVYDVLERIEKVQEEVDLDFLMEEIPKAISQTLEGVERVSHIVRSMKDFSHPGSGRKTPCDLNKALENTITITRNEWKYVAEVETRLDPTLPPVMCYPAELNQVFLNVVVNAAQAIKDAAREGEGKKALIKVETFSDGGWAEVRISDTGPGIPQEIQDRVFDPFFTTKDVGVGTGQGLAIAYDIVTNKHGGEITFSSSPEGGTTFVIRLPMELEGERGSPSAGSGT